MRLRRLQPDRGRDLGRRRHGHRMNGLPEALPATLALLVTGLAAQSAAAPCFESGYGANLHLGLDQVQVGTALGFTFPGPAGPVTSISISSDGFVWLGSNANAAC